MPAENIELLIEFTHDDDPRARAMAVAGLAKLADARGFAPYSSVYSIRSTRCGPPLPRLSVSSETTAHSRRSSSVWAIRTSG